MFKRNLRVGDAVGYRTAKHWGCVYKAYVIELGGGPLSIGLAVNFNIGTLASACSNIDEWVPVVTSGIDIVGYWSKFEVERSAISREQDTVMAWHKDIQQRSEKVLKKLNDLGIKAKPPMLGQITLTVEQLEKLLGN